MKRLLAALVLLLAPVAVPAPAAAAAAAALTVDDAAALAPGSWRWAGDDADVAAAGRLRVVVSLPDQRLYVYRGARLVAVSVVSTGKAGKDTPVGSFAVLQKDTDHRSSLYDDAPMPWMQRLTWDGVALHAGRTPGFPASHGCVRLPAAFAKRLFAATRVGTAVTVTDESVSGVTEQQLRDDQAREDAAASRAETAAANAAALGTIAAR